MGPPTGHIEAGLSSLPGVPLLATQHEGNPSPTPPMGRGGGGQKVPSHPFHSLFLPWLSKETLLPGPKTAWLSGVLQPADPASRSGLCCLPAARPCTEQSLPSLQYEVPSYPAVV